MGNPDPELVVLCLLGGLLSALTVATVYYLSTRIRKAEEGYVAVIEQMDRFKRTAGPGYYFLSPIENEATKVYVRQREAKEVVPNVFTEGGMPVTVNLRYSYWLEPKHMNRHEIYYTDAERAEQQRTLLKRVFQDLVYQLEQATPPTNPGAQTSGKTPERQLGAAEAPDRVDIVKLFSPFAGAKARALQVALEPAVRNALRPHGIMVTDAPVLINGLTLPYEISSAYVDMLRSDVSSSARSDFIRRVQKAAPNMSEAGLIQLFNTIQNPSADIHSIFTGGMLNTEMLLQDGQPSMRHVLRPDTGTTGTNPPAEKQPAKPMPLAATEPEPHRPVANQQPEPAAAPNAPVAAAFASAPKADNGMDPDYPLDEADNALLKTTRTETV